MKNYLSILILLVSFYAQSCQNDSDEPDIPLKIEISGSTPVSFNTTTGQTIKFSTDDEIIYAKVLEIDNHLCPADPGINCIVEGYFIGTFRLSDNLESDTVILRHGNHSFWNVYNDSITTMFSNKSYRLYLNNAQYFNGIGSNYKKKIILTMQLKKL